MVLTDSVNATGDLHLDILAIDRTHTPERVNHGAGHDNLSSAGEFR